MVICQRPLVMQTEFLAVITDVERIALLHVGG